MEKNREVYSNPVCEGADPFVLLHEGKYYLYSTNSKDGYRVYESRNLRDWTERGYCLKKEDVMGERMFWAPEVIYRDGRFYMVYTSEEHLGIAVSKTPTGPFRQENKGWLSERNAIDGHFFQDEDGQVYLYYVRFDGGNVIYGAKMSPDLLELDEENEVRLISAADEWETRDCLVTEGPFMLKNEGKYYLTYSANHYRCPDYAVGCAASSSPLGPFEKCKNNPILHGCGRIQGTGHHSFTYSKDGSRLICVYHCHRGDGEIHPRMTCIDPAEFIGGELVIHGPSSEEREILV